MNCDLKRFPLSIALVTEHPSFFLILSLVVAAFFITFVPFAKTVDNVDYFTLEDNPDVEFYDRLKEVFGNDEFFAVAYEKEDIFTYDNLTLLQRITEDFEALDEARDVISLTNVDDMIGEQDYFEVRKFLEDIPDDKAELKKLKEQAVSNPLYVKSLISPDAKTAAIVVKTYDKPDDPDYRKRLMDKSNEILNHYRNDVDQFHVAGWTPVNVSLSQYMKKDVATFIPISYLLITVAIWLFFRNVRLTLLAVINISVCVGSTVGVFGLTGLTLNNVTTIVIPLVMALALCDTVHIFSHMEKRILDEFPDKRQALGHVLKKVVLPCFLTTLTTAVGFLSLVVSEIPPIREFAWVASAGMVFEFFYSFFFLPPLLALLPAEKVFKEYHPQKGMTSFLGRINALVQRHQRLITVATCVIVITAAWQASKVRVETNPFDFFKSTTPVRTALDFMEKRIGGVLTLDVSLKGEEIDAFKEPTNLNVIDRIQEHINTLKGVDKTFSFVDFIKDMNESFHDEDPHYYKIPETMELVSQYLLLYDSDDIEDYINADYDHARISVRISEHSTAEHRRLISEMNSFIEGMDHQGLDVRVTGQAVNYVATVDAVVNGQLYSLSLAAGVISIIMFLVLRSLTVGILSIVTNFFPVVMNFGVMGFAGIPLDTGTALIAAVALGIAVDDTIHFLSEYNKQRAQSVPIRKSLERVIFTKGRAIISSSLILCIGFGVLILSSFVPTINFGILCAIIMVTAAIGNIVVLPSIILLKR